MKSLKTAVFSLFKIFWESFVTTEQAKWWPFSNLYFFDLWFEQFNYWSKYEFKRNFIWDKIALKYNFLILYQTRVFYIIKSFNNRNAKFFLTKLNISFMLSCIFSCLKTYFYIYLPTIYVYISKSPFTLLFLYFLCNKARTTILFFKFNHFILWTCRPYF